MCNDTGFVKVTLTEHHHFHIIVQVHKILHPLVPTYLQLCFLGMLLDTLVGIVIGYLFLECGPLMDKKVCFIEGR